MYHYKDALTSSRELLKLCQCIIPFSNFTKYCILKKFKVTVYWHSEMSILNDILQSWDSNLAIKMGGISKKHRKRRRCTIWIRISKSKKIKHCKTLLNHCRKKRFPTTIYDPNLGLATRNAEIHSNTYVQEASNLSHKFSYIYIATDFEIWITFIFW